MYIYVYIYAYTYHITPKFILAGVSCQRERWYSPPRRNVGTPPSFESSNTWRVVLKRGSPRGFY